MNVTDPSNLLSELLSDPKKVNQLLETASSLLKDSSPGEGKPESSSPSPPPQTESKPQPPKEASTLPVQSHDNLTYSAGNLIQKLMPVLTAMNQSGQKAVNPDKWNLLHALKPFVASDVSQQMERAIRLISIARMTKTAMQELGGHDRIL